MIVENSLRQYFANLKVALAFGLLLIFVLLLSLLPNISFSSGSMFLEYSFRELSPEAIALPFIISILFLVFYSFFISIIVFSVRKNLSKLKLHYYLREMIQKFTVKIFIFFFLYTLLLYALSVSLINLNVSILWVALGLFIISLLFLFVPQSVVIDEENLKHSILNNFEFIKKNPKAIALVVIVGAVLLAIIQLIEYAVDLGSGQLYLGRYVSLLLVTIFVLPFIETLKTYLYMFKFDLIKTPETIKPVPAPKKKPI